MTYNRQGEVQQHTFDRPRKAGGPRETYLRRCDLQRQLTGKHADHSYVNCDAIANRDSHQPITIVSHLLSAIGDAAAFN